MKYVGENTHTDCYHNFCMNELTELKCNLFFCPENDILFMSLSKIKSQTTFSCAREDYS